jgi:LuxR family maltose regulon positive regulatory protein
MRIADKARDVAAKTTSPWFVALAARCRIEVQVARGDRGEARAWLEGSGVRPGGEISYASSGRYALLASLLLASGEAQEALPVLEQLLVLWEEAGAHGVLVHGLVLQARALHAAGEEQAARDAVVRALRLAAPECYLRPFTLAGVDILPYLRTPEVHAVAPAFVRDIVARLPQAEAPETTPGREAALAMLVEPLSEREMDVLEHLARGLSNREIGLQLSISLATVKWHTSNIYGKLGVRSRTEAVIYGRELGLLS